MQAQKAKVNTIRVIF